MNYIDVIYKNRITTKYPYDLCEYLFNRFDMEKNMKILDIGCGNGEISRAFQSLGLCNFAIDKEESDNHYNCHCSYLDVEKDRFDYKDNIFDFIFCKSLIEHLYKPDNFMKECYRVLKPEGVLILMTPDWEKQMKVFYEDPTHVHPYSKDSISDLLKMFNFKNVTSEIFYHYPIAWKLPILKYIKLLLPIKFARWLTKSTRIKYFRWMNDNTILGVGAK